MSISSKFVPKPIETATHAGLHPYDVWLVNEGVPVFQGFNVEDLKTIKVGPWERKGGLGVVIRFHGSGYINDAYVCEIPPTKSLKPQRQLYEESIYVVSGRGATAFWYEGGEKQVIEWQRHSVFAIPPNVYHQHFNVDPKYPARYFGTTTAPLVFDIFGSEDFIFNCKYEFRDRYSGPSRDFVSEVKSWVRKEWPPQVWQTNFIPDVGAFDEMLPFEGRGFGNKGVVFILGRGRSCAHMSEFPEGTYKKAHRHGPAANVIIVSGKGFSLFWREGEQQKKKIYWGEDSIFVPPEGWFHQHFNTNNGPSRYLPFHGPGAIGMQDEPVAPLPGVRSRNQIEFEDETPDVAEIYLEEIKKTGAKLHPRLRETFEKVKKIDLRKYGI